MNPKPYVYPVVQFIPFNIHTADLINQELTVDFHLYTKHSSY